MQIKLGKDTAIIDKLPNNCPFCHKTIIPEIIESFSIEIIIK